MFEEKEKVLELGFSDFVTKPFQPQELKEKMIRVVLRNDNRKASTA